VLVLQFVEGLSDRQAADAVRARLDWNYALGLDLDDTGFDASVLTEFRARLLADGQAERLLELLLDLLRERGLLRGGGRQRTDATHVHMAVRDLHRLEQVIETLRAAMDQSRPIQRGGGGRRKTFVAQPRIPYSDRPPAPEGWHPRRALRGGRSLPRAHGRHPIAASRS